MTLLNAAKVVFIYHDGIVGPGTRAAIVVIRMGSGHTQVIEELPSVSHSIVVLGLLAGRSWLADRSCVIAWPCHYGPLVPICFARSENCRPIRVKGFRPEFQTRGP